MKIPVLESSQRRTPSSPAADACTAPDSYARGVWGSVPRLDYLLTAGLFVLGCVEVNAADGSTPLPLLVALVIATTAPLALRRRFPLAVMLSVIGASAAFPTELDLPMFQFVALLVAVWSVGSYSSGDRTYFGIGAVLLFFVVGFFFDRAHHGSANPGDLAFVALVFGGAWGAARALHTRQARADALEQIRDDEARAAVAAERGRIARELHDVVAHAVSVMVVQAGAAEQLLDSDPARSRQALHAIQDSGRQAVDELRRLLGILRTEGPGVCLEPQPGLSSLGALVDEAAAAGTPVRLDYLGRERSLPPGVDLCAYRVVQEALTNARKHAPGAAAVVTVSFQPDAVELDIVNELPSGGHPGGGGHGLIGMRERVTLYGGTCSAGIDADRYRVNVRVPAPATGG